MTQSEDPNGEIKKNGTIKMDQLDEEIIPQNRTDTDTEKVQENGVQNLGLVLDEEDAVDIEAQISTKDQQAKDERNQTSISKPKFERPRRDSIVQAAYKIPDELRKNSRAVGLKKGWRKYGGILFAIFSSGCFSLTILLAKVLRDYHDFHPVCTSFWRFMGIFVPAVPLCIFYRLSKQEDLFETIWPLNDWANVKNVIGYVIQGSLGCFSIILRFYALQVLSVADTSVIAFSSPVVVTILAHFCLKEKCGVVSVVVSIFTVVGVFIIARPPILTGSATYDSNLLVGVTLAVASMLCTTGLLIFLRNIRQVHFSLLLFVSGAVGVAICVILGFSLNVMKLPETPMQIFLIVSLGILTFLGQMTITLALKYEQAGPVSVVRCSAVLFAFVWQLMFLGVLPDLFSIFGAGIIIVAVLVTAGKNYVAGLPDDNTIRQRLSCLLK